MDDTSEKQFDQYTVRRVGTAGCEILNHDGDVILWSVNERWAWIVVDALNRVDDQGPNPRPDGLSQPSFSRRSAD